MIALPSIHLHTGLHEHALASQLSVGSLIGTSDLFLSPLARVRNPKTAFCLQGFKLTLLYQSTANVSSVRHP